MIDPRFFQRSWPLPLGLIAKQVGAELSDPLATELMIVDIGSLDTAGTLAIYKAFCKPKPAR